MDLTPIPPKLQIRHGILEDFHDVDFDGFPIQDNQGVLVPERAEVYEEVLEYANNLQNARKEGICLWLYGSNGAGKTHLAISVQKAAIRQGFSTQFANLSGILSLIKRSWRKPELEEVIERRIKNVDFLVIDDLVKEYKTENSDFTEVMFDELVRYRCNRRKPLIITTNTSMDMIENVYGKSVASLLVGRCIQVEMKGKAFPDWRRVKQAKELKAKLLGKPVPEFSTIG